MTSDSSGVSLYQPSKQSEERYECVWQAKERTKSAARVDLAEVEDPVEDWAVRELAEVDCARVAWASGDGVRRTHRECEQQE